MSRFSLTDRNKEWKCFLKLILLKLNLRENHLGLTTHAPKELDSLTIRVVKSRFSLTVC